MRTAALLLLTASAALAAPVPKHLMRDGEAELRKLQGTWHLVSMTLGDKEVVGVQSGIVIAFTVAIDGDEVTFKSGDSIHNNRLSFDAVEGIKRFRVRGAYGKQFSPEQDSSYSYTLDGNTWTWAKIPDGKDAVVPNPAKPVQDTIRLTFTRVKDKN